MRVAVIGAGAVGGLYAGLLARAGHDVGILARGSALHAIREHGLRVERTHFENFSVPMRASDDPAHLGDADLVLVAVKTYDLPTAIPLVATLLSAEGAALTFQNGLEAPDQLAEAVGASRVLVGTTSFEGTVPKPGVVAQLSPFLRATVAELSGPISPRVEGVVHAFQEAGIEAQAVDDGRRSLWDKACFLIPLATMTGVCQTGIGPIRDLPETAAILDQIFEEVGAVGRACGVDVDEALERARKQTREIPDTMRASMARDLERGRRTELEALTGAIVRLGAQHHVPTPTTRTLYGVLKLREQAQLAAISA